jgi:RimJ/RimL family protein N-acetyltransferase
LSVTSSRPRARCGAAYAGAADARSIALLGRLGRLGFRHEGTRRRCVREDDGHHDRVVPGLLAGGCP